jgi:predicted CoA-binding protein
MLGPRPLLHRIMHRSRGGWHPSPAMGDFRDNLIESEEGVAEICRTAKRVAVLGIKTEEQAGQAAFYVPQYLANAGVEVIPVPVYYPDATTILGQKVYRKVADVPGEIDIVDVFRRSNDVPPHLEDILAKKPRAVWLQSGIRNDEAAEKLARAGIKVVQDRCLMVDHQYYARR